MKEKEEEGELMESQLAFYQQFLCQEFLCQEFLCPNFLYQKFHGSQGGSTSVARGEVDEVT